jgi:hypothetical protein
MKDPPLGCEGCAHCGLPKRVCRACGRTFRETMPMQKNGKWVQVPRVVCSRHAVDKNNLWHGEK